MSGLASQDCEAAAAEPIAVIGMACRLPRADDPDRFWHLLHSGSGRDGLLVLMDAFDADFFGIPPDEAAAMDARQRLALELAWEAIEDARTAPPGLRGSQTGIYVGATGGDAIAGDSVLLPDRPARLDPPDEGDAYPLTTPRGLLAGRISRQLGVDGPSRTVDCGQSSSLVAVHSACEDLRRGRVRLALAGGIDVDPTASGCEDDGYVRGEGGAMVLLKPLSAARADGDRVHGLILGGAVTDDGRSGPGAGADAEAVRLACRSAGLRPAAVQYTDLDGPGSLEAAIGPLRYAAGVARLLKVVLSFTHRRLAPSPAAAQDWPDPDHRLIAGVSSVGGGGTGCHLVLAEAPRDLGESAGPTGARLDGALLLLSARSAEALQVQAGALLERITALPPAETDGLSLVLARARRRFEHRAVVLGEDRADLLAGLGALAADRPADSVVTGKAVAGKDVFVFPGQGSRWPGMALGLLETSPEFTRRLAECGEALRPYLPYSLLDLLRGTPAAAKPERAEVVQPALWAVMVALAELWRAHGVEPATVVGTSQGEIAAATVIGALTLDDAARLVTARSRIAASRTGGALLSLAAPLAAVTDLLAGAPEAALAVVNGPRSAVVSGPAEVIEGLLATAATDGHRAEILPAAYASHSPAADPLREELLEALAPIRPRQACATFVSTVTGLPVDPATLDAEYWFDNLRRPVRFDDAVSYTLEHGAARFIECSPHPVLCGSVEENAEHAGHDVVALGTLARDDSGPDRVRRTIARAWTAGAACSPITRW